MPEEWIIIMAVIQWGQSYAMTMTFIKNASFYNSNISVRAYAKLKMVIMCMAMLRRLKYMTLQIICTKMH